MGLFRYSIAIITAIILSFSGVARADCVDPASEAGVLQFTSSNARMEYCNGADWISFPRAGEPGCGTLGAWVQEETYPLVNIAFGNGLFVALVDGNASQVYTSPDGINWTPRTVPSGWWTDVIYASGQFVATARNYGTGEVMTSPDGITWTSRTAPGDESWMGLTYGNGRYVAVSFGPGDRVMSSTDGINWTPHAATAAYSWDGVAYGNGRFVAVAEENATDSVMTSTDGMNWTPVTMPSAIILREVIYAGGQFVAISDVGGRVATSPDGLTWTIHAGLPSGSWVGIAYGGGRYVATGYGGPNQAIQSTDGITWTPMAVPGNQQLLNITYGNRMFVTAGTNGIFTSACESAGCDDPEGPAGTMVYSNNYRVLQWCDGANWQALGPINPPGPNNGCVDPAKPGGNLLFSQTYCVLQYCDGDTWRGIGKIDPCACDPDAGTWTAQVMPESQLWRGLVFGNGMFVAAGINPASSPDGINWTVHNTVALHNGAGGHIAFGNGLFVAPSQGDWTRRVSTSPDGVNWTAHDTALPPSWPPTDGVGDIVYGDNQFVIVGGGGGIATSPDGIAWTPRTSGVTTGFTSVTYGNGIYVASGQWFGATPDYPVVVSPDGINWTPVPAANVFNAKVTRIDFGNGLFVGKTYQGGPQLIYSTDGVNWMAGDPGNVYSSWATLPTIYANGLFVTAGSTGGPTTLYSSEDGITWSVLASPSPHGVGGIAYGNGVFVTVNDGTGAMRATCVGGG